MFRNSKKSNASGRGLSDLKMTVYLSGVSIDVHHLASSSCVFGRSRARSLLNLTAAASISVAVVELHALAQVELDGREVRRDVPALGQHRLHVVVDVVLRQAVVDAVVHVAEAEVRVEAIDVDVGAVAQRAARFRLRRRGRGSGRRTGGFRGRRDGRTRRWSTGCTLRTCRQRHRRRTREHEPEHRSTTERCRFEIVRHSHRSPLMLDSV